EDAYSYTPEYIRNQMEFNGSKITKTIVEDTFSSGTGSMTDIKVVNGKMTVQPTVKTWRSFAGKKWSDL
ncbi:phage tail protein, partial [Paenibacillus alvei]|nr:phage tail protein [Paenibacillus alvei]